MKLRALASLLVLGVWAGTAVAQPTAAEIQKMVDDYTAAWSKGDAKGVAGLYTDTAVRVEPTGVALFGRVQIQAQFEKNFAGPWKGSKLTVTQGRTTAVTGDAIGEGKYIYEAMRRRKQVIYTAPIWRWIMLIIQHIPSVIFRRMSF